MVNMLTFGFLPYVQAQTELLLGMKPKKKFNVTEKVVIKGSSGRKAFSKLISYSRNEFRYF